jgi:hypothetical protein
MESSESNRSFERLRQRWENNTELDLKEKAILGYELGSTGSR